MIKFNRDKLKDKIYACWIGKNLGGTIGTPYEGSREINDIKGFVTKEGQVLPNDDLDLQLIWLKAMEEQGPEHVDEKVLGEYWINYILPHWNEYGIGKCNMIEGFLPPLAGELNNTYWKHSNGAWIRTEVWATLYPGLPEKAIKYAFADACVDHGYGEGTYAAIFVAAIEAAAFVITDINELIDIGLSKIPADCRVARSVNIARKAYCDGIDWKTARQMLVEDSADLGWFQAPANIGFVIIGLLYGEGDFKKSMITAVNCGDDTDCTGATLGSILGIIGGTKALPEDWVKYMGDDIVQMCLIKGHGRYPESCTELTDCIMNMHPVTLRIPFFPNPTPDTEFVVVHDGDDDFGGKTAKDFYGTEFVDKMFSRTKYSFTGSTIFLDAVLELNDVPQITPNGSLSGKVSIALNTGFKNFYKTHYHLRWFLPEGWTVSGRTNLMAVSPGEDADNSAVSEFTITAGENVAPISRIVLEISCPSRPNPLYLPICIMG